MECPICLCEITDLKVTQCNHEFCTTCIDSWLEHHSTCPCCRQQLRDGYDFQDDDDDDFDFNHDDPRFTEVTNFIDSLFPSMLWTIYNENLTMANLAQHHVSLLIHVERDWLPLHWVEFYRRTYRNDIVEFLNAGVSGNLLLNGIDPPEYLNICYICRHISTFDAELVIHQAYFHND